MRATIERVTNLQNQLQATTKIKYLQNKFSIFLTLTNKLIKRLKNIVSSMPKQKKVLHLFIFILKGVENTEIQIMRAILF